jgi:hypothetical protein
MEAFPRGENTNFEELLRFPPFLTIMPEIRGSPGIAQAVIRPSAMCDRDCRNPRLGKSGTLAPMSEEEEKRAKDGPTSRPGDRSSAPG